MNNIMRSIDLKECKIKQHTNLLSYGKGKSENFIDVSALKKFRKSAMKLNFNAPITIKLKNLEFSSLSSLNYFESIIYIISKLSNKNIRIILTDGLKNSGLYFSSSIFSNYITDSNKINFDKNDFMIKFNKKNTVIKSEEGSSIRFIFDEKETENDIFTLLKAADIIPDNLMNSIKRIISELMNNVDNHDDHSTIILTILNRMDNNYKLYEVSFLNFSGNKMQDELIIDLRENQNTKYNEIREFFSTTKLDLNIYSLPFLLVNGVTISKNRKMHNKMGGTGLYIMHKKILEQVENKSGMDTSVFSFIISGETYLNPNNIPTYENTDTMITEYMTDVKKNTRKIKNNFNGVIYNLFLLDTIKEENNE